MDDGIDIPRDILYTLMRGLVWQRPGANTQEETEAAWAWLEKHNHYEEMGQ